MSKHSSRGKDWQALRLQILARDNHTCVYCGNEATEVDHVTPKAAGGTDSPSNLVAACKPCNLQKSSKVMTRVNYVNKTWLNNL